MSESQINKSQILLYQTEDGRQRIEVRLENETVWLSQKLMAELFQTTPQNINIHLKNIFSEGELSAESVSKESLITFFCQAISNCASDACTNGNLEVLDFWVASG